MSEKFVEKLVGDVSSIQKLPHPANVNLRGSRSSIDVQKEVQSLKEKTNVLLPPLSRLTQEYPLPDIIQLVHNIRKCSNARQLFLWASVKNIADRKAIPFMEHMADIVVSLKNDKHLSVLTKKSSGSVSRKVYRVNIVPHFF